VKFRKMMRHWDCGGSGIVKFTYNQNQNGPRHPIRFQIRITASTPLAFEMPAFRNRASYLNSQTNTARVDDHPISAQNLTKFGPGTRENSQEKVHLL